MNRDELIARKGAVRAEIAQVVRRLGQARSDIEGATGLRRRFLARQIAELESRQMSLAAEESRLRQEIDRSGRTGHGTA